MERLRKSPTQRVLDIAEVVAEMGFLTSHQIADHFGFSPKQKEKVMGQAKKSGLFEVEKVSGKVYAPTRQEGRAGTAPDILKLTTDAAKKFEASYQKELPVYLPHELRIRDVCLWWKRLAVAYNSEGAETRLKLTPWHSAWPDAFCNLPLPNARLAAIVEVDRGTERGVQPRHRWPSKYVQYHNVFAAGDLTPWIGIDAARILVFCETWERAQSLSEKTLREAPNTAWAYWFTYKEVFTSLDLFWDCWINLGKRAALLKLEDL